MTESLSDVTVRNTRLPALGVLLPRMLSDLIRRLTFNTQIPVLYTKWVQVNKHLVEALTPVDTYYTNFTRVKLTDANTALVTNALLPGDHELDFDLVEGKLLNGVPRKAVQRVAIASSLSVLLTLTLKDIGGGVQLGGYYFVENSTPNSPINVIA